MKKKIFSFAISGAIFLLLWQLASVLLNRPFLPTPTAAVLAFIHLFWSGEITGHFLISAYRVGVSIVLAMLLAVPLGLVLGQNERFDRLISPLIYLLYPLPKVVFLPIIVVMMGLGDAPKIFLITLVIFFQIVVVARDASRSVPAASMQSIRSLNAGRWQTYYHLVIPYCLPQILTSLRVTVGTAIAILFFAETFASVNGIGYFILDAMDRRAYDLMYGGIIAMACLGILAYMLCDALEHIFCRWQKY